MEHYILELKQKLREDRKSHKPWRSNMMKSTESLCEGEKDGTEYSGPVIKPLVNTEFNIVDNGQDKENPDKVDENIGRKIETKSKEPEEKPWRENMKRDANNSDKGMDRFL